MLNLDVSYRTLKIDYNTKAFLKNSFVLPNLILSPVSKQSVTAQVTYD